MNIRRAKAILSSNIAATSLFCVCSFLSLLGLKPPRMVKPIPSEPTLQDVQHGRSYPSQSSLPHRIVVAADVLPAYATLRGDLTDIVGAADFALRRMQQGLMNEVFEKTATIASIGDFIPNIEEVLRLHPDVVFAWPAQVQALYNATLFDVVRFDNFLPYTRSHTEIWRQLGRLTDETTRADQLLQAYQRAMDDIKARLSSHIKHRPRVMIVASSAQGILIGGELHYLHEPVELAGGKNIKCGKIGVCGKVGALLSMEDVLRLDPDVILLTSQSNYPIRELFDDKTWRIVRAVREHKVYRAPEFPAFLLPVFDPLLVQWLAEVLHPTSLDSKLRGSLSKAYEQVYHYKLSNSDLDKLLLLSANRDSFGYSRFAARCSDVVDRYCAQN